MSDNTTKFPQRPKSMFNDYRYPMPKSITPVEGAKWPAWWGWELGLNGSTYFKSNDGVYNKDDKNFKLKECELSFADRNSIFNLMENSINDPNFTKASYVVKKTTFGFGGKLNDHPSILGKFTIIRTSEGMIQVVYSKGTYKVPFEFKSPYDSVIMVNVGGEVKEDPGLMSRIYCKSFIDFSRKFLDQYEFGAYKPRPPKDGGGSAPGNSGGGQRQQQSAPSSDFDDDIDF